MKTWYCDSSIRNAMKETFVPFGSRTCFLMTEVKTKFAKTAVQSLRHLSKRSSRFKFISISNRSILLLCKSNYIVAVDGGVGEKKKAAFVLSRGEIRKCVSVQMTLIESGESACERKQIYI